MEMRGCQRTWIEGREGFVGQDRGDAEKNKANSETPASTAAA
jgi:hypothetical protein